MLNGLDIVLKKKHSCIVPLKEPYTLRILRTKFLHYLKSFK